MTRAKYAVSQDGKGVAESPQKRSKVAIVVGIIAALAVIAGIIIIAYYFTRDNSKAGRSPLSLTTLHYIHHKWSQLGITKILLFCCSNFLRGHEVISR